jgi:hypothetical protein
MVQSLLLLVVVKPTSCSLARLSFFIVLSAGFVIAQASLYAQPASPAQASSAQISDRELRAFVKTYVETQNIRREYEPPIEKSTDPDRTLRLQQSANQELKEALARNDLTVEQYNRIFAQVNGDKDLRQRVLEMVERERKGSVSPGSRTR